MAKIKLINKITPTVRIVDICPKCPMVNIDKCSPDGYPIEYMDCKLSETVFCQDEQLPDNCPMKGKEMRLIWKDKKNEI